MVYRVLADGIDIFGSDTESSLLSPSLETELNSAGSLEFTLPPDHPSYDDISLMQTEIEVYEDNDLIFFGRPAEINIDWNNQKKVVCEGALAYLNDAAIRPHKFEGTLISDVFKYIIEQYNAQVAQNRQFIVGNITIVDRYVYTEFDYDICLSVLTSTCIDSTGGYLFLRKEDDGIYIDWLDEVPDVSDQPVQFASNMLDLTQDTRAEDICTVVLPVGGQVDGVNITIASVNQGSDILEDSDAIAKYGRILKIQQWNDIIDPQALKDKATEWLTKQQEDDITIETDAAELHYLDGSVGAYRIGQLVNVISGPHGVDKEYPILKMSMDLDSGTKKITLGTPPRKELTELSGITNSTGGGNSSSGGGGGSSDGVRDVIVNGSSVVSDHVARISAVTSQQLADALALKADEDDFEVLQTTVAGKQDKLTPGTGIEITNNVISATGGGGTSVVANPSDPATDDLNTIKIGNTVYDIPGGGSTTNYGKFTCDVLFVNDPLPTPTSGTANVTRTYTLGKSIDDYDAVYVIVYGYHYSSQGATNITSRIVFKNDYYLKGFDNYSYYDGIVDPDRNRRINFTFTDSTHIQTVAFRSEDSVEPMLCKVYGLKFENKLINRSDIYSEEERMIGRWTDGKLLYQKTVYLQNVTINKDNYTSFTLSNYFSNVEKAISYDVTDDLGRINPLINANSSLKLYDIGVTVEPNSDKFTFSRGNSSNITRSFYFTLRYTKTTDQPGSGFLPEDPQMVMMSDYYSEEEQVVGRWTDGKPLYQKTTILNGTYTGNMNSVDFGLGNKNIEVLVFTQMIGWRSNDSFIPIPFYNPTSPNDGAGYVLNADRSVTLRLGSMEYAKLELTIQYTKTTDAPGTGPTKGNLIYLPALYSEEEREVGVWKDGKPIYQKNIPIPAIQSAQSGVLISNLGLNIDTCVDIKVRLYKDTAPDNDAVIATASFGDMYFYYRKSEDSIRMDAPFSWVVGRYGSATIQYTKTTDQPGSGTWTPEGQLAHHYSISEKIVGTWIDGSTIYERTWDFGSNVNVPSGNYYTGFNINSSSMDKILSGKIMNNDGTLYDNVSYDPTRDNHTLVGIKPDNSCNVRYLTLQYTKTS